MVSDEIIEGSVTPPKSTGAAAVLAAFREVTDWSDEDVLHYAECSVCDPFGGDMEYYCRDSPHEKRRKAGR